MSFCFIGADYMQYFALWRNTAKNALVRITGEQEKTINNRFFRSECAETRSNGSEACPHARYDYVSRELGPAEPRRGSWRVSARDPLQ